MSKDIEKLIKQLPEDKQQAYKDIIVNLEEKKAKSKESEAANKKILERLSTDTNQGLINLKEVIEKYSKSINGTQDKLLKALKELDKSEIKVVNLKDIPKNKFPTSMKISNLDDMPRNIDTIKKQDWVVEELDGLANKIEELREELSEGVRIKNWSSMPKQKINVSGGGAAPAFSPKQATVNDKGYINVTGSSHGDMWGFPSDLNSGVTTLNYGVTWVGQAETNNYPDVGTYFIADVAGKLTYQFQDFAGAWHDFPTVDFATGANIPEFHTARKLSGRPMRPIWYPTGASAPPTIAMLTSFGVFGPPNAPINQSLSSDADAIVVRTPYDPVEVALSRINGIDGSEAPKFGYNPDIDNGQTETLWYPGGIWQRGTTHNYVRLISDSTGDGAAGAGARTVIIYGVGVTDGSRISETITMNGTTGVTSANRYKLGGINRMVVASVGSSTMNIGNISAYHVGESSLQAYIPADHSVTQQLIYTVADDEYILLDGMRFTATKTSGGGAPRLMFHSGLSYGLTVVTSAVDDITVLFR